MHECRDETFCFRCNKAAEAEGTDTVSDKAVARKCPGEGKVSPRQLGVGVPRIEKAYPHTAREANASTTHAEFVFTVFTVKTSRSTVET